MEPVKISRPPAVLLWYRVYCGVMLGLQLVDVAAGAAVIVFRERLAELVHAGDPGVFAILGVVAIGFGALLALLFALTFFLPPRPWAWVYHLLLIGLGLTDCFAFLPCLFLLLFWLKPQTRTYFGCDQWIS